MKVLEEKKNDLLNRKEVKISLEFAGQKTPSQVEVIKQAAGLLKTKEDLIYVDEIKQMFGNASGYANLFVYDTKANLDKIHFIRRKKLLKAQRDKDLADRKAAKEGKAAAPVEQKTEAKPAEKKAETK